LVLVMLFAVAVVTVANAVDVAAIVFAVANAGTHWYYL
jgi:hypothetical protein